MGGVQGQSPGGVRGPRVLPPEALGNLDLFSLRMSFFYTHFVEILLNILATNLPVDSK